MEDLEELYRGNEDFRGYVDRCCANDNGGYAKTAAVEEVLGRALTREVAAYYREGSGESKVASSYMPLGECV